MTCTPERASGATRAAAATSEERRVWGRNARPLSAICAAMLLAAGCGAPRDRVSPAKDRPRPSNDVAARAAYPRRPVYRHSIVPGGVYSAEEFRTAARADAVVDRHYAAFDRASLRLATNARDREVYVSFRVGSDVFWTRNRVKLPAGEPIVTDGRNEARARCGNRVSATPQEPVAPRGSIGDEGDPGAELEFVSSGPVPPIPPVPGTPVVHGPPSLLAPDIFRAPDLKTMAMSQPAEGGWNFPGPGAPGALLPAPQSPGQSSAGGSLPSGPVPPGGGTPSGGTPAPPFPPLIPPGPPSGTALPAPSLPNTPGVPPVNLVTTIDYSGDGTVSVSPPPPPPVSSGTSPIGPGGDSWIPSPPTDVPPPGVPEGGGPKPPAPPTPPPTEVVDVPPYIPREPPVVEATPEPGSLLLVAAGIGATAMWARRRARK